MAYGQAYRPEITVPLVKDGQRYIVCVGGPWDGKVVKDIFGDTMEAPNTGYRPTKESEEYRRVTAGIHGRSSDGDQFVKMEIMAWGSLLLEDLFPALVQSHLRRALWEGRQNLPPELSSQ
jgi:hypothetical protein